MIANTSQQMNLIKYKMIILKINSKNNLMRKILLKNLEENSLLQKIKIFMTIYLSFKIQTIFKKKFLINSKLH